MAGYLNWQSDEDCVAVGEFVLAWIQSDLTADTDTEVEAKDISLYAFLCDILVCVGDDRFSENAQSLLAKIGQ